MPRISSCNLLTCPYAGAVPVHTEVTESQGISCVDSTQYVFTVGQLWLLGVFSACEGMQIIGQVLDASQVGGTLRLRSMCMCTSVSDTGAAAAQAALRSALGAAAKRASSSNATGRRYWVSLSARWR